MSDKVGYIASGEEAERLMRAEAMKQAILLAGKDHIIIDRTLLETIECIMATEGKMINILREGGKIDGAEAAFIEIAKTIAMQKINQTLERKET